MSTVTAGFCLFIGSLLSTEPKNNATKSTAAIHTVPFNHRFSGRIKAEILRPIVLLGSVLWIQQILTILELSSVTMASPAVVVSIILAGGFYMWSNRALAESVCEICSIESPVSYFRTSIYTITFWFMFIRPIINLTLTWLTITMIITIVVPQTVIPVMTSQSVVKHIVTAAVCFTVSCTKLFTTTLQIYFLLMFSSGMRRPINI